MDGGLKDLALVVHEAAGMAYYWLCGWTGALLPAP